MGVVFIDVTDVFLVISMLIFIIRCSLNMLHVILQMKNGKPLFRCMRDCCLFYPGEFGLLFVSLHAICD